MHLPLGLAVKQWEAGHRLRRIQRIMKGVQSLNKLDPTVKSIEMTCGVLCLIGVRFRASNCNGVSLGGSSTTASFASISQTTSPLLK